MRESVKLYRPLQELRKTLGLICEFLEAVIEGIKLPKEFAQVHFAG